MVGTSSTSSSSSSQLCGAVFVGSNAPAQFPAVPVTDEVVIEAYDVNQADVQLGISQGSQPISLAPGAWVTSKPDNLDQLWLNGSHATDGVWYHGR